MKRRNLKLLTFVALAILGGVLFVACKIMQASDVPKDTPVQLQNVASTVMEKHQGYRKNTVLWSLAFHGCFFAAAFLSAASGIILKLESVDEKGMGEKKKKDIAAVFAGTAALLLTLSGTMNFNRKWETNRVAAYQTENLLYEISSASSNDLQRVYKRLQEIVARQNEGILGMESVSTNAPGGMKE